MDDVSPAAGNSSGVRCRSATIDDEPFLWTALLHAIYVPLGAPLPSADVVRESAMAKYVEGWSSTDLGFIAEASDGACVGAAWLRVLNGDRAGFGYVADDVPELAIAVLPGWRGRGIGGAMLRELISVARSRHRRISLSVNHANPARRLYERFGFREVATRGDAVTMLLEPG